MSISSLGSCRLCVILREGCRAGKNEHFPMKSARKLLTRVWACQDWTRGDVTPPSPAPSSATPMSGFSCSPALRITANSEVGALSIPSEAWLALPPAYLSVSSPDPLSSPSRQPYQLSLCPRSDHTPWLRAFARSVASDRSALVPCPHPIQCMAALPSILS